MTTIIGRNVRYLMAKKGLSATALARATGTSTSTITRLINGQAKTTRPSSLTAFATVFGVTVDALQNPYYIEEDGKQLANQKIHASSKGEVPIVRLEDLPFKDGEPAVVQQWLAAPPCKLAKNAVAVLVTSNACAPELQRGDIAYVEGPSVSSRNSREIEAGDGDFVLAEADGEEKPVIRMLMKGDRGTDWLLASNKDWPDERSLPCRRILGIVVGRFSALR